MQIMSHSRQMLHNGDAELVMDPNQWMRIFGTPMDWGFHADPNAQLNGRAIPYSMGKVLGGGSSVNVALGREVTKRIGITTLSNRRLSLELREGLAIIPPDRRLARQEGR
jgi:hypothetical protein